MSRETSVRNVQLYKHYLRVSRNEKETSSIGGVIFHWSPNEQVNLEGRFVFAIKICLKIIYLRKLFDNSSILFNKYLPII